MSPEERKCRELRNHLKALTAVVTAAVKALDAEMKLPSTNERGQRIARITNALEMAKDSAVMFGLGLDPKTGKKRPKPAAAKNPTRHAAVPAPLTGGEGRT